MEINWTKVKKMLNPKNIGDDESQNTAKTCISDIERQQN